MIIAIYVNQQYYKNMDLGPVSGYDLGEITDAIRQDYDEGKLGPLAPTPRYSLGITVIEH
jgi:hypothetical protein